MSENNQENKEPNNMARLSKDAILLSSRLHPSEPMTLTDIALNVFNGKSDKPGVPRATAVQRTKTASLLLISLKLAKPVPNKKEMVALISTDQTGGSVCAQSIMNMVVRSGVERRGSDRREEPREEETQRRAVPDRRLVRRVVRSAPLPSDNVAKDEKRIPSPFDIVKDFKF